MFYGHGENNQILLGKRVQVSAHIYVLPHKP